MLIGGRKFLMHTMLIFKCECCGMESFKSSNTLKDRIKKDLTCPFCESELLHSWKIK